MPFALAAVALALASATVAPPAGEWRQIGKAPTSKPGAQLHFFRTALAPRALAIVVTSSSRQRLTLSWASDCEVADGAMGENRKQATVTGIRRVVAYPPVDPGVERCYVWVNATIRGKKSAVASAVFSGG